MTAGAVMAGHAGNMMGDGDPVACTEAGNALPHLHDLAGDLVSQYQGNLAGAIPFHDVAAADATGLDAHEQLAGTDLRPRHLFQPQVAVAVIHRYAHMLL